jgi:death-on-curing protein
MRYLTSADLMVIHELLLSEFGGMRGITEAGFGRLEAAAAAPRASMFGEEIYVSVTQKAAALCQGIVRAHPFSDGNKRVALVALDLFMALNGARLVATNDAAYATIMALARGELGRDELAEWVEQHVRLAYLDLDDILRIRDQVAATYADRFEIMSPNGLLSALAAPRRSAFGAEAFPTLAEKAGALVYSLIQNHPFWDGNKRIASAALRLFVERNTARLVADDQQLRSFTTEIAKGALRDGELVEWIAGQISGMKHVSK